MLDGNNTTIEWQLTTNPICVLPVGSFEQHGPHLPLSTDIISAEYFGRMVADGLGAALLPAMPFGTCMEHSGFRGSVSLSPDTLMQIVRDIAGEVESQNFTRLIVLNGHGGNFALGPVIRDWNRQDRSLKILLINFWEFWDESIASDSKDYGPEIHAGEKETSLMLAVSPEVVQMDNLQAAKAFLPTEQLPLAQRDLTTFGVGHFNPAGAVSDPTLATEAKGQALIRSVRDRLIPYLLDRLHRLETQPRYAGGGGIAIRIMLHGELDAALRLTEAAEWNQTAEDWKFFLQQSPEGCFAAVHNGHVVGTTTTIQYDKNLAWISMVLVDPKLRRLGVGRRLLLHALDKLGDNIVAKLDATPKGLKLYQPIGFEPEYFLRRWVHESLPQFTLPNDERLRPISKNCVARVAQLDSQHSGAPRLALIADLASKDAERAWLLDRSEASLEGFVVGRAGKHFHQLGPIVATRCEDAILLVQAAFSSLGKSPVVIDVPDHHKEFIQWLRARGFVEQRSFVRMSRDTSQSTLIEVGPSPNYFAICGPEFG